MAIELDKDEGRPVQPGLSSKLNLNLDKQKYDLAAIIYHHNFHFWCEVFVHDKRYKEGWYLYNDMWNNGKAEFVGKYPQVKTPSHMYILLFEKSQVDITSSSRDQATCIRNLISVAFQNNITPDTKQVKKNYLNILKSSSIHFKETTSCKELKAILLENEQSILNVLNISTTTESMEQATSSIKRENEHSEDAVCSKKFKEL